MTGIEPALVALAVVVMIIGLLGVVVPVLPGLLLIWAATVGTLLLQGTDAVGWSLAVVLTLLAFLGTLATVVLPARRGRQAGAARSSLISAALGAAVGFFVIPVAGFVIGGLAGLLLGERRYRGAWEPALASTVEVVRAYGIGVLVEFALAIAMIVIWGTAIVLRG